ncbi:hypothetical protein PMI16_01174 [Herbaspirillum sp. CF444]|uniref:lysozyme inhibitor LprI family protein n=1 Tax=Herbaspirillum sp. CF444 TaxID=1144319 RepID=UPI00027283AB|nr:lysozyme inhibitor LprI family protein [Herbaspirillum sp. CF444]EJL92233.1 hypothetical protein PMI16_01174 [Herbaspirillum sp. CF444]
MNLSLWRLAALLSLSTLSIAAHALDCDKTGAETQSDMDQCSTQALNKADAELNQTYIDYRNRLNKSQQNQIRDVQLAWIKYRDLSCKYASSSTTGGSAHGMALQSCLTQKTQERTKELKVLSSCPEGDVSCPR